MSPQKSPKSEEYTGDPTYLHETDIMSEKTTKEFEKNILDNLASIGLIPDKEPIKHQQRTSHPHRRPRADAGDPEW